MTPAPNEIVAGPPDEEWHNSINGRAWAALVDADWTIYARSVLPAHVIHRLNTEFPGWRLERRVEQDQTKLSLKRVWFVIVFATPEQAFAYERGTDPIPT